MASWQDRWMISCEKASRLSSEALDHALSPWQRLRLALHLRLCQSCLLVQKQFRALHQLLNRRGRQDEAQDDPAGPALNEAARQRIKTAIQDQER